MTSPIVSDQGLALIQRSSKSDPLKQAKRIFKPFTRGLWLFSALLATVGPQGGQGTVRWLRCKPHRHRRSVEVRPPGEAADETEAMTAR